MTQSDTFQATIDIDLAESTQKLLDFNSGMERLFRVVDEAGATIETPFKGALDSTNRLKGDIDAILDQFKVFGRAGNDAAASLEGIADPIKRAEAATQLLGEAMQSAKSAESDLAAEAVVAAAKLDLQTGATKSLLESVQKLNPGLAAAVGHINSIGDAEKRSSAAAALFAKSQAPVGKVEGAFGALGDSVNAAKAKMASLPPLMQTAIVGAAGAAAGAVLALAAAVGTTLVDAWKAWAAQSKEAMQAQEDLDASTNRLQVSLGQLAENLGEVSDTQEGLGVTADKTASILDKFNALFEGEGGENYSKGLAQMNQQFAEMTPMMGWFFGALLDGKDALSELGEEQKQANALLQASNPLLIEQAALMDQLAESSRQAGSAMDGFESATKEAQTEAWKLERALDELDRKWSDTTSLDNFGESMQKSASEALRLGENLDRLEEKWSNTASLDDFGAAMRNAATDALELNKALGELAKKWREGSFDAQNAEGFVSETGGGLLAEQDKQAAERKKKREEEEKERKKEKVQKEKDLRAIAKMDWKFKNPLPRSGGAKDVIEQYKEEPYIQKAEKAAADLQKGKFEIDTKSKENNLIKEGEDAKLAEANTQIQAISSSMNDAAKGALMLGASMAAMSLETLIAGESMAGFGWQALQAFGSFASQAGQVILATGIGQLALFEGNPGGAIAAGIGLMALGSVLGGLAKRNMKQGGAGGGGTQAAGQIIESFASRNKREEEEEKEIIIYAQFGTERLEPFVANATMSAQRNGRLPRGARA